VNCFASKGYEVHIITYQYSSQYKSGFHPSVKFHCLFYTSGKERSILRSFIRVFWRFFHVVHTVILLKRIKPDIVNAHYITGYGDLGAFSGFHPFILNTCGSDVLIDPKKSKIRKINTKFTLNRADLIIVDSDLLKREIIPYGIKEDKIKKIFNGIDIEKFSRKDQFLELKKRLLIDDTSTVILNTRGLRPVYNVEMFIKAIPLILQKRENVIFIILNKGELMESLKNLASTLGVKDSIRFIGGNINNDQMPQFYSISDIYVSTSLSDSTSLSLQEAMACEVVPIVTDIPANREWITNGNNGFIIKINDVEDLSNKIITLIDNENLRKQFNKINRQLVVKNANYYVEMEKVEKIYKFFSRFN